MNPNEFSDEAVGHLLWKDVVPKAWDSAMWSAEDADIKTRSFFSARVENARFLDRAQGLIFDYMTKVRDDVTTPDGTKTTALRVADRAHFVRLMREFMVAEGMAKPEEFAAVNQGDLTEIRSRARLNLIFDTHVRQAYGYGQWKQGMTPGALSAFPAARLIRDMARMKPRERHQAHLGDVRLKTDFAWWAGYINAPEIGGFGNPWGPFGYNSGCTTEDVSREEAEKHGLKVPLNPPKTPPFNDGLSASIKGMGPETKRKLLEELRGGPKPKDPVEAARRAAADTRRIMLNRGLTEAVTKGDTGRARKYREALDSLPTAGLNIRETAGKIVLESAGSAGMVPPLPPLKDATDSPNEGFSPAEVLSGIRAIRPTEPESSGLAREIRSDREAESLASWADERGALWTKAKPPKADDLTGGEHLVEMDEDAGIVFKATHPGKFGFAADVEMIHPKGWKARPRITAGLVDATPEEYLERLENQNGIFNDGFRVLGAARFPQGLSILTSQPFYKGTRTEQLVINTWFAERGWREIQSKEGAFYNPEKDLLLMDALPRNVLTLEDGKIMPFDVVIVKPSSSLKAKLGI